MRILETNVFYGSAYLLVSNNEVWRVWIGDRGTPLTELLTPLKREEWERARSALTAGQRRGD